MGFILEHNNYACPCRIISWSSTRSTLVALFSVGIPIGSLSLACAVPWRRLDVERSSQSLHSLLDTKQSKFGG